MYSIMLPFAEWYKLNTLQQPTIFPENPKRKWPHRSARVSCERLSNQNLRYLNRQEEDKLQPVKGKSKHFSKSEDGTKANNMFTAVLRRSANHLTVNMDVYLVNIEENSVL